MCTRHLFKFKTPTEAIIDVCTRLDRSANTRTNKRTNEQTSKRIASWYITPDGKHHLCGVDVFVCLFHVLVLPFGCAKPFWVVLGDKLLQRVQTIGAKGIVGVDRVCNVFGGASHRQHVLKPCFGVAIPGVSDCSRNRILYRRPPLHNPGTGITDLQPRIAAYESHVGKVQLVQAKLKQREMES